MEIQRKFECTGSLAKIALVDPTVTLDVIVNNPINVRVRFRMLSYRIFIYYKDILLSVPKNGIAFHFLK